MKRQLGKVVTFTSTLLFALVLATWGLSYAQNGFIQHRDTAWSGYSLSQHHIGAGFGNGRFYIVSSQYTMNVDFFSPEKWPDVPPEGKERLLAFKSNNGDFHGWDRVWAPVSERPATQVLRDSALGLEWDKLSTPQPGKGTLILIPIWLVAAILGIPGAHWLGRRHRNLNQNPSAEFGQPAFA